MSNTIDSLVMCTDEQFIDGDPAGPDKTVISFMDEAGDAVCRMEFYSDQECEEIYSAVLRYAKRIGVKKTHMSNVNNHYYT